MSKKKELEQSETPEVEEQEEVEETEEVEEVDEKQFLNLVGEAIEKSPLAKSVNDLSRKFSSLEKGDKNARAEKSFEFIKEMVGVATGEVSKKTISTDNSSMGYSVPTELADAIYQKKDKIAKIAPRAFTFNLAGNFQLPKESAGVTGYWVTTEADEDITESNPTLAKSDLTDNYLASRVRIPYKLMNTSAFNVENYVAQLSSRQLVSKEETAFVGGDGDGKPTGIRQASITDLAQSGASLAYDDIVNLFYAVPEQYRIGASFLASTMAVKAIRKIKDDNGVPIFNVNDQTIFGRPVLEVTDIPENLGTSADETEIYFGDLQDYWIKRGETMQAEVSKVSGRLQVDLFMYESVDGVLVNTDSWRKLVGVS